MLGAFGQIDEGALARMMRPTCTECGSGDLLRGRVVEVMGAVTPEQRRDLAEGLAWLERAGEMAGADSQAWICRACGEMGIFGGMHSF